MNAADYPIELEESPQPCNACGSAEIVCLGALASAVHCRCRNCGWTFTLEDHGDVES